MSNYLMVPVKPVKADLLTELKQTIYVPIATKQTYGSVKIGDGFTVDNGVINFDKSEVTILSISLNGELLNIDDNKNVNIALTKNDVGLDQVDNTSDKDKPISNAQQEALNRKLDKKQSLSEVGKFLYVSDDGDIDFKNVDTIKVKLNNETIDAGAGIFNFSNNFVVTSVAGGQVDIDLSEEFKESVGKIDSISLNGVPQTIDVNKNVNLVIPIDDKLDKSNADRDVITNQTISINGDNVSLVNSYINLNSLVTKTQSNKFSLANDNQAGLMSVSDYKSIRDLQARVGQLEQKATRLLYDEKLYPTADEINTFVTSMGYMVPFEGIAVVVSGTNHIWHYYEGGTGWKDDGVDVVSQFTNDIAGIIKGSASDGKVYAETDGTGSVYGWDSLKNNVTNLSNQFVNYTPTSNLSAVALSGNYSDLLNKPTFSTVATSGSYNDLLNLPDLSAYVLKSNTDGYATGRIDNFVTSSGIVIDVDGQQQYGNTINLTMRSGFAPSMSFGAGSSDYGIGFNLDSEKSIFSGRLYNLRNTIWSGESSPTVTDDDMVVIKSDLDDYTTTSNLAAVAISNSYNDLDDKPIIPEGGGKLYSTTGQNTDGAMTQKATTDALPQCIEIEMNMQTGQASITVEQFEKLLENPENYIVVNMSLTDSDGSTRTESVKFTRGSYRKAETSSYWVEHLLFNSVNTGDTEKTPYMYLILARHSISPNDIGIGMGGEEYATVNQLNNKVDKVTNMGLSTNDYTTADKNKLAGIEAGAEVNPTSLSELSEDATHRLVTDTEKSTWNAKSDFSGSYNDLTNKPNLFSGNYNDLTDKPTIPTSLSELSEDATHRLVTDTEKTTWNAKSDFSGSYNDLTDKPTISTINVDGQPQSTLNFDSDPQTQIDNIANNTTIIKNSVKGFNAGEFASAGQGGAVGWYSYTETGFSGGSNSNSNNGGAIGNSSVTDSGGAVGSGASSGVGFSGGYNAKVSHINGAFIDAIQLGTGTNTTEKSLQIYDDNIYNASTHTLTVQNATVGGNEVETIREDGEVEHGTSGQNGYYHYWYKIYSDGTIVVHGVYYTNTDAEITIPFNNFSFRSIDYFKCAFGSIDNAAYSNGAFAKSFQTTYITFASRSAAQWYTFYLYEQGL